MRLLQLSSAPIESVNLTIKKTVKVWLGKFRMQPPNRPNAAMSTVFVPIELQTGDSIEINGLRQAMYCDDHYSWLEVRLYGIAFNGDRYFNDKLQPSENKRADVWRILPFERSIANGTMDIGKVFHGKAIPIGRTTLLPQKVTKAMIDRAELLPTLYAPLEWQLAADSERV